MKISGFHYFNAEGERGYIDTPDDPYWLGMNQSRTGNSLFNKNSGISWCNGLGNEGKKLVSLKFDRSCRAQIDDITECVVVVAEMAPLFTWPNNAAVFNRNGELNHVVDLPEWVADDFGEGDVKYRPEGFYTLKKEDGVIVFGIYFCYDRFQLRLYDVAAREWGRTCGTGRA